MWGMAISPAVELVRTIEPPPDARRCGMAALTLGRDDVQPSELGDPVVDAPP